MLKILTQRSLTNLDLEQNSTLYANSKKQRLPLTQLEGHSCFRRFKHPTSRTEDIHLEYAKCILEGRYLRGPERVLCPPPLFTKSGYLFCPFRTVGVFSIFCLKNWLDSYKRGLPLESISLLLRLRACGKKSRSI